MMPKEEIYIINKTGELFIYYVSIFFFKNEQSSFWDRVKVNILIKRGDIAFIGYCEAV